MFIHHVFLSKNCFQKDQRWRAKNTIFPSKLNAFFDGVIRFGLGATVSNSSIFDWIRS